MADPGWIDRIIDGRYLVEGVIGAGGMGMVLRCRHRFTGDIVAVKVLRPELAANQELQQRFLAEARAPSSIGHAGIVKVIDAGRSQDGLLYLVMELLQGRPLRVAMERNELTPRDARRVLLELLDALIAAHARGFVHRDLKPDNVFIAEPGAVVKLLDFGIAKVVDGAMPRVRTATGSALGTPAYMSPEQIHEPSGVDARTDLWSVGVIVFEMLTGRLPFHGASIGELLASISTQAPVPIKSLLPDATPQLETFFATALARQPSGRYASATAMKQALWAMPFGTGTAASAGANMTLATGYAAPAAHLSADPSASMTDAIKATRNSTPLVVGVLGVLGIAAVVTAIVLTRQPPTAVVPDAEVVAVVPDAGVVDAMQVVAIDAGRKLPTGRDAGARLRDAGRPDARIATPYDDAPTPRDAGVTIARDAAVPVAKSRQELCKLGCAAATKCGTAFSKCETVCMTDDVTLGCVTESTTSCALGARCGMAKACGHPVAFGGGTCLETMNCQIACRGSLMCSCSCAKSISPKNILALTIVDRCLLNCAKDNRDCTTNCVTKFGAACSKS